MKNLMAKSEAFYNKFKSEAKNQSKKLELDFYSWEKGFFVMDLSAKDKYLWVISKNGKEIFKTKPEFRSSFWNSFLEIRKFIEKYKINFNKPNSSSIERVSSNDLNQEFKLEKVDKVNKSEKTKESLEIPKVSPEEVSLIKRKAEKKWFLLEKNFNTKLDLGKEEFNQCIPTINHVLKKYQHRFPHIPPEDLEQELFYSAWLSFQAWKPNQGMKLNSYLQTGLEAYCKGLIDDNRFKTAGIKLPWKYKPLMVIGRSRLTRNRNEENSDNSDSVWESVWDIVESLKVSWEYGKKILEDKEKAKKIKSEFKKLRLHLGRLKSRIKRGGKEELKVELSEGILKHDEMLYEAESLRLAEEVKKMSEKEWWDIYNILEGNTSISLYQESDHNEESNSVENAASLHSLEEGNEAIQSPLEIYVGKENKEFLAKLFKILNEREQLLLNMNFGLGEFEKVWEMKFPAMAKYLNKKNNTNSEQGHLIWVEVKKTIKKLYQYTKDNYLN